MPCRTAGALRIIGGDWRGRKFNFIRRPSLRPSGDRVRESLFNCLGQRLDGLRCLDLFAGSGALGLEAASRGASAVTLVEKNRRSARSIREAAALLGATQVRVLTISAEDFLADEEEPFDMIFLDPPFTEYDTPPAWRRLLKAADGAANIGGRIYAEGGTDIPEPAGWITEKQRSVGAVHWRLFSAD